MTNLELRVFINFHRIKYSTQVSLGSAISLLGISDDIIHNSMTLQEVNLHLTICSISKVNLYPLRPIPV